MISEEEFADRIVNLAKTREFMSVREFNDAVLRLVSELTIVRNARNRQKLFAQANSGGSARDETEQVREAHQDGRHCGRIFCTTCEGRAR